MLRLLPLMLLWAVCQAAAECRCSTSFQPCSEAKTSNLVFTGTVEAIEPTFLSRRDPANRAILLSLNESYKELRERPSASALARLKEAFGKAFPDLPDYEKRLLDGARTAPEMVSLFDAAMGRGMRVRFKVSTLFKHESEDDDKENDEENTFDVWTPFSECGMDFQTGESYLVYANSDEGDDTYFTGKCTRTRRLTEAGEDLAYLAFYKRGESARVWGFVSADRLTLSDFDKLHDPASVRSPVAGVGVELRSGALRRFAQTDRDGRFAFDGLAGGGYRVSVTERTEQNTVEVEANGCALSVLIVPR